jgi:hypothetical protein
MLAGTEPTVVVIEEVHRIDAVSESMRVNFLAVIPRTPSMVLITYRPEHRGALPRVADVQTIALAPLSDSDICAPLAELLGSGPSVGDLARRPSPNPPAETILRGGDGAGVGPAWRAEGRPRWLRLSGGCRRRRGAGNGAGGHRGAHRQPQQRGQADRERGVGDRGRASARSF